MIKVVINIYNLYYSGRTNDSPDLEYRFGHSNEDLVIEKNVGEINLWLQIAII